MIEEQIRKLKSSFRILTESEIFLLKNKYKHFINAEVDLITHIIKNKIKEGYKDIDGSVKSIYFEINGEYIGLFDESLSLFFDVCNRLLNLKIFNNVISYETIKDLTFEWLKSNYSIEPPNSLLEFIKLKAKELIDEIEIWIPIQYLQVKTEFSMGNVLFKNWDDNIFTQWLNNDLINNSNEAFVLNYHAQIKREFTDHAVSIYNIKAERQKAIELAYEETEKSLDLLRIFDPSSLHPNASSYVSVYGKIGLIMKKCLIVKDNILLTPDSSIINSPRIWTITNEELEQYNLDGLNILNDLLKRKYITVFQKSLIKSIRLYSQSILSNVLEYRLALIFASLEPFFVNNNSTAIQKSVSEAMALLLSNDLTERKYIINIIKKVYHFRSSFVHEGKETKEFEIIKEFLSYVRNVYLFLIKYQHKFNNRKELIEYLEDIKLSASINIDLNSGTISPDTSQDK